MASPSPLPSPAVPLRGITVGISVAFGEDSARRGFTEDEMNRSVVRLSEGLLAAGANLVFGHDWRLHGVMAAVARLAVRFEPPASATRPAMDDAPCRITNLVPFGTHPELPEELRRDLEDRGLLRIEEGRPPRDVITGAAELPAPVRRALALSELRRRMADLCHARVGLGGKYERFEGFWAGIFEEAWSAARRNQPVYLSCLMGGAAARVLEACQTGEWARLLEPRLAAPDSLPESPRQPEVRELLDARLLQGRSGLELDDWHRLVTATDIEGVLALVLKGLRRLRRAAGEGAVGLAQLDMAP